MDVARRSTMEIKDFKNTEDPCLKHDMYYPRCRHS